MDHDESPFPLPVLVDSGIRVRPYLVADAPGVVARSLDEATARWTTMPRDLSEDEARRWIIDVGQRPTSQRLHWAIEADGRYAGHVGLRAVADGGHIHFGTCPWVRGRGAAGRAAGLVSTWALEELGWSAIVWRAHAGNIASARSAWRAGFGRPLRVPRLLELDGRLVDGWYAVRESVAPDSAPWEQYLPR